MTMGRPPKHPTKRMDTHAIRVTTGDWRRWLLVAKMNKMKIANYIRHVMNAAVKIQLTRMGDLANPPSDGTTPPAKPDIVSERRIQR